jgi:hypothetical protein
MSPLTTLLLFVLALLTPIAFLTLIVWGVVQLTNAENKKRAQLDFRNAGDASSDVKFGKPLNEDLLLEVHISKSMTLVGLFLSIAMLGFGLAFFLLNPVTALVLGWWLCILGLVFTVKMFRQLAIDTPTVTLTTAYIEHAGWPFKRIPWKEIKKSYIIKLPTAIYLNFEVEDQQKLLQQMSWFIRNILRMNRIFGGSPIQINLTPLKVDSSRVLEIVKHQIGKSV